VHRLLDLLGRPAMRMKRAGGRRRRRHFRTLLKRVIRYRDQIRLRMLLRSFTRSHGYVPSCARRIRSADELPLALQSHTHQVKGLLWRAWVDGTRVWFVLAGLANGTTPKDRVGLQLMFFDMDGRLAATGVWIRTKRRGWLLHTPRVPATLRALPGKSAHSSAASNDPTTSRLQ
jgi:hypothetical protein